MSGYSLKKTAFHGPGWLLASIPLGGGINESHHTFDDCSLLAQNRFTCETSTTMSRHLFSNNLELVSFVKCCREHAADHKVRELIVLENASNNWLKYWTDEQRIPFIDSDKSIDRTDRITALLGSEYEMLAHALGQRFDAGLLASLAGTIRSGGVLLIGQPSNTTGHFHQRFRNLVNLLAKLHPTCLHLIDVRKLSAKPTIESENSSATDRASTEPPVSKSMLSGSRSTGSRSTGSHKTKASPTAAPVSQPVSSELRVSYLPLIETMRTPALSMHSQGMLQATMEQNRLFAMACLHLDTHQRCSLLITGRRGRGKSMLLARIADWLQTRQQQYHITAARQAALSTVYRFCSDAKRAFVSPDNASNADGHCLLIDEASTLPLASLYAFAQDYDQTVFSTTIEGYENAGRAFAIRFTPMLKQAHEQVLELQPEHPWRWAHDDVLEQLIDQLLLTDAARLTPKLTTRVETRVDMPQAALRHSDTAMLVRQIHQAELTEDEQLLHTLFAVLRDLHYQTSTQDLEHLLDSPDIQIWIVENNHSIVSVAILALEGPIERTLHEAIVSKQRRLPHQLLPQLLAQTANNPEALRYVYARIIRIAVAEPLRRKGIASLLLKGIVSSLVQQQRKVQAIGASFGETPSSIAFWQANGFTPFHQGFKPNPRTGNRATAVIKGWNIALGHVIDTAVQIHQDNELVRSTLSYADTTHTESETGTLVHAIAIKDAPHDLPLLSRFACDQRSMNDTLGSLNRLAIRHGFCLQPGQHAHRARYERSLRDKVARLLADEAR